MRSRKLFAVLLAMVMILSGVAYCFAGGATPTEDIVILHTNDAHCGYLPYDKVATLAKDADLLVDAGDAIQGDVIGTLSKGEYVTDIMNYLGYDLATFGNHEFDYGMDQTLKIAKELASFPYVSCNFVDLATGNPVVDAYKVFDVKGVKIAFVGVTTPETFVKSTPTYFQDSDGNYIYGFCQGNNGQDLYDAVQKAVTAAAAEADFVIVVGHLGDDAESQPWTSEEVIAHTTGIDAFIDGHSHGEYTKTVKNADGKEVVLQQTGTKLSNVGKLVIKTDGTIGTELVALENVEADAAATAYIQTITDKFDELQNTVVAKTLVDLTTKDADGKRAVRNQETNLGDLCADAYRTLLDADVAFVNGGGVRADIPAGDITFGQIIAVHPFGNSACLVEVTGQQILDALELGSSACPGELGGFLQVSGLTYTIDTRIPSGVVLNDESEFVKVEGERRVKDVLIGGEPVDPAKTYKLASHNYMLKSAGDGYAMFGKKNVTILQDEVLIDNQVLINYITDSLGGTVGEDYAKAQGRITIIPCVQSIDVTIDAPQAGQPADFTPEVVTAPEDAVEVTEVTWMGSKEDSPVEILKNGDCFKAGYSYSVSVTLAAKDGQGFNRTATKASINGEELTEETGTLLLYPEEGKSELVTAVVMGMFETLPECEHKDADKDGKCDVCGETLKAPETGIAFAVYEVFAASAAGIYLSMKKRNEK